MKTNIFEFKWGWVSVLLTLLLAACGAIPAAPDGTPGAAAPTTTIVETVGLPVEDNTEVPESSDATATPSQPDNPTPTSQPDNPTPTSQSDQNPGIPKGSPSVPLQTHFFPGAKAVDIASAGAGTVYIALGRAKAIVIRRSTDGGLNFSQPVIANPNNPILARNIERPSIAVDENGNIGLVWLENESKKLWYTLSTDGGQTYSIPTMLVSGRDVGEGTWLPRIAVDQSFTPFVAWIQAGKLVFAYTEDGGQSFIPQIIDQEVCECCPPNPVVKDDRVYIVYRDRSTDAQGRVVRGINLIFSGQGNLEFNEPVPANDAPWYLDVCPLSGPVLAIDDQRIYVAWMDGRNDKPNSLNRSDIWLAISTDGGQSFSDNIRLNVNDGVYNNKPAMVLGPDGRLHIVWEADEGDQGFVYYVTSDDGGQTLTAPVVVVANERGSEAGLPTNVRLAVDDAGRVYLMWVDKIGAHLWIW